MKNTFTKNLVLLRKQRGFSQKQVAISLGISQALLSHYENGARECGLDILVKLADFYGVTTDFLLGRTILKESDQPSNITSPKSVPSIVKNRQNINSSLSILFDLLARSNNLPLSNAVYNHLVLSVYQCFRTVYTANSVYPDEPFVTSRHLYQALNEASMIIATANLQEVSKTKTDDATTFLNLSTDYMKTQYDKLWNNTQSLVNKAENLMNKLGEENK